ncbi:MAG: T-complex protein 1 subunit beta [Chrysothrix sp. TS-e1954]|nr:MAG: T-complex protein 1 subunit beta [Chrysothrix sp. TS-e1954]
MSYQNPTQIFADDVTEEKGENARLSAFVGAIAIGDMIKSTLGPKGMDKILQSASSGEIMVTNDGATILKSIALDNAAAKVLVNISKVQDDVIGDGTTSVAVLAAELLREAEKLVAMRIHPQTIIEGYRIASSAALTALEATATNNSADGAAFREDLLAIARTTLSSKVLAQDRDHFAALAVDAVLRLKGSTDLSHIQLIKKPGGKLRDSYLDSGFILDKKFGTNQPKKIHNARILVANTGMDTDKIKIFGARVRVDGTSKLAELEKAEREKMRAKVDRIKSHGINVFVNRQLIYNWPESLFAEAGISSIEHADFDGVERLALVTGADIASTFDHPELVQLGHSDVVEEVIIGEDTLIRFGGVAAGRACTVVLRGATEQLLDEAERSLHDALAVLSQTVQDPRITLGGGSAEMNMSCAVTAAAAGVSGKKALAVDAFATALRQLPTILADNAGLDSSDLVAQLRKEVNGGFTGAGLDLLRPGGGVADMRELGVLESFMLKRAVVGSAGEAAELLLRVDNIVRSAPRRRERM